MLAHVRRMAHAASSYSWFQMMTQGPDGIDYDREQTLRTQVVATRDFIASHVIW